MTDAAKPLRNRGRGAWTKPIKAQNTPGAGNPQWVAGKSGNPHGKPIGSRNRISKAFLESVLAHWEKNGTKALDALLKRDPLAYAQMLFAISSIQDQPTGGAVDPSTGPAEARARVLREIAESFGQRAEPPMLEHTPTPNGHDEGDI